MMNQFENEVINSGLKGSLTKPILPHVVHISYAASRGGAARAAYRQHQALNELGVNSEMFVFIGDPGDTEDIHKFKPSNYIVDKLIRRAKGAFIRNEFQRYASKGLQNLEIFTDDRTIFGREPIKQVPSADIINLHWVARFVDYRAMLGQLAMKVPLVWTLHDMNPFTGGCHYSMGCRQYTSGCGTCPQLGSKRDRDLSRSIWLRKKKAFSDIDSSRLNVVCPSEWLTRRAQESALLGPYTISHIPYGLDTNIFKPRDAEIGRELLGIAPNDHVVLFVSHSTANLRKGMAILYKAISSLAKSDRVTLVSVGQGPSPMANGFDIMHTGSIGNDRILSFIYSAADVFVIPTLADNLPNTVLESMACGTPVVGFDVGGLPDMVHNDVVGTLVPVGDTEALLEAIKDLLDDNDKRQEMGDNCRRIAEEEYSLECVGKHYLALYEKIMCR